MKDASRTRLQNDWVELKIKTQMLETVFEINDPISGSAATLSECCCNGGELDFFLNKI